MTVCVRCVVCAVLRARERPTERARAVARAGEYKCDYLAVREVRGCFDEKSSCESTLSSATLMHTRLSILHTLSHATRPLSISLHPSNHLSSPAPRNTSDPLNVMTHTSTHAASLFYHSPSLSLSLPLPSLTSHRPSRSPRPP